MDNNKPLMNLSRRNAIKYGGGFLGTGLLAAALGSNLNSPEPVVAQSEVNSEQALAQLMAGNKRFVAGKSKYPNQNLTRLQQVALGQKPFAAVLSCADSRVPVEIIFDQGFGDIFVVRDAGNIATDEEIGSLEFGTLVLGAKVLLVIGHEACGAVVSTLKGAEVPGSISSIIEAIEPAVATYKGQQDNKQAVRQAVEANVRYQVKTLEKSPVLSKLIQEGKLKIVGAYYSLSTREITLVS
ncbi:carbonic anhydrase [Gloeothece verrucosa]|uniref:carbonic anhydrase n=1 Tax=Gloeothece verrucosa (strain PCC 7822) TaxID=497965 RepID=E0UIW1_GLOV7|nr:carbonic anhydrase [Gloeothece verrucosa]ADN13420.1 carbonic anhydrase [Gloeothece verrucosa PCC 7822]